MSVDSIGIVTVQDGPSLPPGEIIAPDVGTEPSDPFYHKPTTRTPRRSCRPAAAAGRQYVPLTDGTYFHQTAGFASIQPIPENRGADRLRFGVVVSYYGPGGPRPCPATASVPRRAA